MSKVYEYKGKTYSNDYSISNGRYNGDLTDLYRALHEDNLCFSYSLYATPLSECYESIEELIEGEFSYLIKAGGENE